MEVTRKPQLHQDWIDSHAYGIVKALQKGGFTTYLVGGCVRDLLLGIHPKDFDIATAAHPPQVKRTIHMAFVIGKRFRLVLVKRDDQQFEVATFRREANAEEVEDEMPASDNLFGTPEEDARRRDFTFNALFYDPVSEQLIDYVNGLQDIEDRIIRMIGDPATRLREDPIRIMRALRLSHKLNCRIEPLLREAIRDNAGELARSVLPRRREEILKILRLDDPEACLMEAFDLGILEHVLPGLHALLLQEEKRDAFLSNFRAYQGAFQKAAPKGADTFHLFGWLVFSMFQAAVGVDEAGRAVDIQEDERFVALMRDELGMHKMEQTSVANAIYLLPSLRKTDDFTRRGERRQFAFLNNEGFPLALTLADAEHWVSGHELGFWRQALAKMQPELEAAAEELRGKRRRPRRRRPRGGGDERRPNGGRGPAGDESGDESGDDADDLDEDDATDLDDRLAEEAEAAHGHDADARGPARN